MVAFTSVRVLRSNTIHSAEINFGQKHLDKNYYFILRKGGEEIKGSLVCFNALARKHTTAQTNWHPLLLLLVLLLWLLLNLAPIQFALDTKRWL